MKKKHFLFVALFFAVLSFGLVSCEPSEPATSNKVKTGKATEITQNSALLHGEVDIDISAYSSVEFGMMIATTKAEINARMGDAYDADVLVGKDFEVQLNGLSADTKYYYCAWLFLNNMQYEFGEIKTFETLSANDSNIGNGGSADYNGHAYVDLGLPSGLKWATCNVGATKPEEYGNYYAWGEVEPKEVYNFSTYKWMTSGMSSWKGINKYTIADGQTSGVWYDNSGNFIGDNKTTLDKEDDAAAVNMGGSWRMPTKAEQEELRTECTWTRTTLNDVSGYTVTGPNGNSIFLPAAGYRYDSGLYYAGSYGRYWSSSLDPVDSDDAYDLYFNSGNVGWNDYDRCGGQSVRGVSK